MCVSQSSKQQKTVTLMAIRVLGYDSETNE